MSTRKSSAIAQAVPKWKEPATAARKKVVAKKKKEPTLAELNRILAATRTQRLEEGRKNCMKLTGKPSF